MTYIFLRVRTIIGRTCVDGILNTYDKRDNEASIMSKKNDDCKIVLVAQVWQGGKMVSSDEVSSFPACSAREPESMDDILDALDKTETIVADAREAMAAYTFKKLTSGAEGPKKKTSRK